MTKREAQSSLKFKRAVIARALKSGRKKLGMNQTDLAPLLGLDQSALSRCETGRQNLTACQWLVFKDIARAVKRACV